MASQISRVAIIGAGPTGLACARYLLAEKYFIRIDVLEQRDRIGGIWNLSGPERSKHIPIPQTNPRYGSVSNSRIAGHREIHVGNEPLEFESPLYDQLETNIPKTLMPYSDTPFSADLPLFPGHADVLKYLDAYAEPVRSLIQFSTQVTDVHLVSSTGRLNETWSITTHNLQTRKVSIEHYDAVIVANGHYTVPSVPPILGVHIWNASYPGTIIHSKAYRRPEDFAGKKCLVIGNSASGVDIAAQLSSCAQHPVILASRSSSQFTTANGPAWRRDVPEIVEFLSPQDENRAVKSKLGDVISDIDAVIFATGYFYSYPFLFDSAGQVVSSDSSRAPSPGSSSEGSEDVHKQTVIDESLDLVSTGLSVQHVYKHFLHIQHATLALPVLNLKVIPFPLAENQAAVIARLWSGRLNTPSIREMQDWCKTEEQRLLDEGRLKKGGNQDGSGTHILRYPEDVAQVNELYNWACEARPRPGLENNGNGKLGTKWGEDKLWLRSQFADIKAAFSSLGDSRKHAKSLEDLPRRFDFHDWDVRRDEKQYDDLLRRANITT